MTRIPFLSIPLLTLLLAGCQVDVIDASPTDEEAAGGTSVLDPGNAGDGTNIYQSLSGVPTDHESAAASGLLGQGDLTVLMIVDRSGSMGTLWDGGTKWQIARASLNAAIVGVEDQVTIGALFFPMEESCDVLPFHDSRHIQFQRGALFQADLAEFPDTLGSGTPMYSAFIRADQAITQAALDGRLEQRFRVVVVTDGEPNCSGSEDEIVAFADSWRDLGVDVRVMGLPGSEAASRLLDRIAGKEVVEGEPYEPPPTVVNTSESSEDSGYVAPATSEDVDDSLHAVVR